ncbi:MAG: DUF3078 domain-containing protein [Alloprevotella sp.]|nr:DUF3078 domain-containing protein [Alloprevotella sp.]
MTPNRRFLSIVLSLLLASPIIAQTKTPAPTAPSAIAKSYADSVSALISRFSNWHYNEPDTLSNPYYFPLFTAPTYYGGAVKNQFSMPSEPSRLLTELRMEAISKALAQTYSQSPWLVGKQQVEASPKASVETPVVVLPKADISKPATDVSVVPDEIPSAPLDIDIKKPNFWSFPLNFSFQLMQNYVSSNWYKGGESNRSFLASLVAQANYDNKQKFIFNNKLEAKFGLQSSRSDTQHKYKTNYDLIRLTNEVGLRASKHWYYSVMLQSWTQFSAGYKKNDPKVYSDFLSPFESLLTFGMKYTFTSKNKKFTINANISPLACDFIYVSWPSLETAFGLKEGHHTKFEVGSNITATYNWTIWKNISWEGRIYYYTNYKRSIIEWENTINLKINRFLSTQIFLYPRFDDGVPRVGDKGFFQFKEYLSVGFDMSFF